MPKGPIGGSFAWRAEAFHDYDSWALHVTPADVAEIEAAAASTRVAGLDIRKIERKDFLLPGFAPKLATLRHRILGELGFGYVRGLPVERGKLRGGAVIAPDREWIVPLEAETPAY
jgi:hypothetical protein